MNDLNLRVSGGVGEKVKKPAAPISMYWTTEKSGATSEFFTNFLSCKSADNQLKLLKTFLYGHKNECMQDTIQFLVMLFWHTDAKHPVKGFLKKHITDSQTLCHPFTEALSSVITAEIKDSVALPYVDYVGPVTRLDACIDKFPPGANAVSSLEIPVASYLVCCLESCIGTLDARDGNKVSNGDISEPLAPTEINKIYELVHLTLRLLLYMIQKITDENRGELSSMFTRIKSIITQLMLGKDVPMDTKSVSGIIYVTLHLFENGPGSWITLLEEDWSEQSGTVNLAVYSAIATVVPPAELTAAEVAGRSAVLVLTDHILEIGDRYSSEATHTLLVSRTVLSLARVRGARLAARLARHCWPHMEHHADCVRHLAGQAMARVVATCVSMHKAGDSSALDDLFASLSTLDCSRKSFYVTLTALAEQLGAGVLARRPGVVRDVIAALHTQAIQACATTFLETLLKTHMKVSDTETIYQQWITVILDAVKRESEPAVLSILEKILTKAVQWDSAILDHILSPEGVSRACAGAELKAALLALAVARRAGAARAHPATLPVLHAAHDADDEIRILSLSLIAESRRSTEPLSEAELRFVLYFLRYNINAQAPNFRQLVLARLKKILKRLEDSSKVLQRKESEHSVELGYYSKFVSDLRELCFSSLELGGSCGRRGVALQLLVWTLGLAGCHSTWTEEEADILYGLLEDSYDNNRALALAALRTCPPALLKAAHAPGQLAAALAQAGSARPADCVAAACKLLHLVATPIHLPVSQEYSGIPEHKHYALLSQLLQLLHEQCARAQTLSRAARDAPMHGLLHCATRLLQDLDAEAIAEDSRWSALVAELVSACELVNARVAPLVCSSCPEGLLPDLLPADAAGITRLEDGRAVTAQMVLLCGWRSIKETSLLLGTLAARLRVAEGGRGGTLSAQQLRHIGELFMRLLETLQHRGAFEQAYVGFTMLLARLWKCSSPELHQLPLQWFSSAERALQPGAAHCCATRRGAGLPFMIQAPRLSLNFGAAEYTTLQKLLFEQALVTTELAVESTAPRGRLLSRCLELCLRIARERPSPADAARAHLVLRALYRHSTPPAEPTAEAIMVAVRGFEADTWMERNSSTLLFSALTVRVFGVLRARSDRLCVRNRMTGRIFFLRYPQLYDFLLDQLESSSAEALRPALFPTLLLLARLYPSALEGTVSNLKLERFLRPLRALGGACAAPARRRAARAAAPLLPPDRYVPHMLSLLATLGDPNIKRNLCHGLLCQLSVLLDLNPEFTITESARSKLLAAVRGTFWVAAQAAGRRPCFPVADEWLTFINLMLLRFPNLLDSDLTAISSHLEAALSAPTPFITSGREIYLANAVYMLLIIATRDKTVDIVIRGLQHADYEVNLSALNYLLLLHGRNDDPCAFLEHLSNIPQAGILEEIEKNENYVKLLCSVSENGYLECKQKALRVLSLTDDTQKHIVKLKMKKDVELSEGGVIMELIDAVRNGPAKLSSIYLHSLLRVVNETNVSLDVVRVLYASSSAGNEEDTRETVVRFLEKNLGMLLEAAPSDPVENFSWRAMVFGATAMLLEDDAPRLRTRAAAAVLRALHEGTEQQVLASYAAERWQRAAAAGGGGGLLLLLAALDFCADVDTGDELGEECRVFEHNESHNAYLEEGSWAAACARALRAHALSAHSAHHFLEDILYNPTYKDTIRDLCIENVAEYLTGTLKPTNPKIDLFLKILHK